MATKFGAITRQFGCRPRQRLFKTSPSSEPPETASSSNKNCYSHTPSSKFLVHCNSQITKNGQSGNIRAAESIFNRMAIKNVVSWTAMLTAYADNEQIKQARQVFDEMPERSVASWNAMITAYIRSTGGVNEAGELFTQMPERNAVSYGAMITGFVQAGMLEKAEELHAEMPLTWRDPVCSNALISGYLKMGELEGAIRVFEGMAEKDVVSWSSMLDGYCRDGRIVEARYLFDMMPQRNVVTWTAMIRGYLKKGDFRDGFRFFLAMRRDDSVKINSRTLTVMFEACGNLGKYGEGYQVHGLGVHMGFDFDVFLGNSVIAMYCRFGCMDAASTLFHTMNQRDVVSWNTLIAGYIQDENIEEGYRLFKEMPEKDVVSWTTMIAGFSSKGVTGKSVELFKAMSPEKDDVAWTAVISGFGNNEEYEEAICWFKRMLHEAVRPNLLTLSSVLSACAGLAALNQGLQMHARVLKTEMQFEVSIQNALVSMYSKCGNISEACRIFESIADPNIVSFNSMITGFAQNGHGKEAVELLKKMRDGGKEPNDITFLGVLSACTHTGLVEEGWNCFKAMKSSHNMEPGLDHYACMVDLLGRAGLLDEAVKLIDSMPFQPHSGVWGALLGASRTHFRLDLAKLATQHLFELEPYSATPYVVLSDMYSLSGKVKDGEQVRITKKSKGIKKIPGCSWVIVNDKVNLFSAGDQSHEDFQEIARTLWVITDEMQQLDNQYNGWGDIFSMLQWGDGRTDRQKE
ncbi:pentatricopeptide repeat-containing protein At1g53600, mitochondrial-like isoform X2 [Diospyros lotus]|uniref:pentatricopeptide repeat-containing protein At1g53600, mitochondrial-like isoform X2 n=1 Tax=Diospyros lotus TaxID=55363 RepID=UPI00225716FD|nr:pentatricopeptide repeat-containing protein At1g53600, mitochondrial-like isoform X2 [Diospyros lotus]